jgi:hypothetical protein
LGASLRGCPLQRNTSRSLYQLKLFTVEKAIESRTNHIYSDLEGSRGGGRKHSAKCNTMEPWFSVNVRCIYREQKLDSATGSIEKHYRIELLLKDPTITHLCSV